MTAVNINSPERGLPWSKHEGWPVAVPVGKDAGSGKVAFDLRWGDEEKGYFYGRRVLMGMDELIEFWKLREDRIRKEKEDPLRYGFELECWADADEQLEETSILCLFGGNRSGKTEYIVKRAMRALRDNKGWNVLFLTNNDLMSKQTHQKVSWKYMPPEWRNLKRGRWGSINYDAKNGFSDGIWTSPNEGTVIYGNYDQDVEKYEGGQFNLILPDENMPLPWYNKLKRGLVTRAGKMIWGFTAIDGMTPAIAEVAGGGTTIKSIPADAVLPAGRRHVDDCPVGHMPYISKKGKVRIVYFPSRSNPFGGYKGMLDLYGDSDREVLERRFHGFARRTVRVIFPKFCDHHILPDDVMLERLGLGRPEAERKPGRATWYQIADPAGARNMFQIWVAVDGAGRHFVVREWPDMETLGEWAVLSESAKKWDGDAGPAQQTLGYGVKEYKAQMKRVEDEIGIEVYERLMDPRSGAAQAIADREGGSSLMDRFAEEHDEYGPMEFVPAPGLPENEGVNGNLEGVQGINDLLAFDKDRPLVAMINEPKLYISARCKNLIWALSNYTGNDGAKAACKDPIDCLRYMATADLQHYSESELRGRAGGYY